MTDKIELAQHISKLYEDLSTNLNKLSILKTECCKDKSNIKLNYWSLDNRGAYNMSMPVTEELLGLFKAHHGKEILRLKEEIRKESGVMDE